MAISKKDARRTKSAVLVGEMLSTGTLSSTNTTETMQLSGPVSKFSVQSTGDLEFSYEVSITGEYFDLATTVSPNNMVNFDTNLVAVVRFTWVSGTGRVALLAVS